MGLHTGTDIEMLRCSSAAALSANIKISASHISVSISKIINTSSSWLLFCIQGRLHHHTWFLNMCHEQPVTEIFVNKPIGGQIIGAQIIGGQIMDGQIIGNQTSVTGNLESRWTNDLFSKIIGCISICPSLWSLSQPQESVKQIQLAIQNQWKWIFGSEYVPKVEKPT